MTAVVVAVGTIGGPLLGGFMSSGPGWRWAFLINLPLGILTLVWVAVLLRLPAERRHARIDWPGAALLAVAITTVVLLSTWAGSRFAWLSPPSIALALATIAATAAFVWRERRAEEPIVPLAIFSSRSFTMAAILSFVTGVVLFACVVYLPLFQQNVQGASASASGLQLLPMMVPVIVASEVAGRVMTATGRYRVFPIIGCVAIIVGGLLLATLTVSSSVVAVAIFMVFMGIGSGLTPQMTTMIAQNSVEPRDIGVASGVTTLLRNLGGSIGVAVYGTVYAADIAGLDGAAQEGVAAAVRTIFVIVAAVGVVGLLASLGVREVPLRERVA